jgi:DNA-binding IclR family transcriptional regulator
LPNLPETGENRTNGTAEGAARDNQRDDVSGAQSVHKALQVMRLLAGSGAAGLKLVEIAAALDFSNPTTFRILKALEQEGVVERVSGSRSYTIGAEMVWLGLGAANRFPIALAAAPVLAQASVETGHTLLLNVRSGVHSVCAERANSNSPLRVTSAVVGSRKPLGVSPAGRTMLAFLPADTSQAIMQANAAQYEIHRRTIDDISSEIENVRSKGYLYCDGMTVRNTCALTVPVFDPGGVPVAAICAIAPRSRLQSNTLSQVVRALNASARTISDQLLRGAARQAHRPAGQPA